MKYLLHAKILHARGDCYLTIALRFNLMQVHRSDDKLWTYRDIQSLFVASN